MRIKIPFYIAYLNVVKNEIIINYLLHSEILALKYYFQNWLKGVYLNITLVGGALELLFLIRSESWNGQIFKAT